MASNPKTPEYVLGSSNTESQRLAKQGDLSRGVTERFLVNAGLSAGMKVLDLGCGAGDVSLLVAELVGSQGSVVGVDRDAAVLEFARKRLRRT
jgi:ubiquinone/menaquinone biosynthesis C-methylase UbiE